jgi:crossover junction endodeoxyribonuclease RusA
MIQLDIKDITIKPYVRMTQRGKYVNKQAQQYLASKGRLSARIREQMNLQGKDMMPAGTPLKVVIRLYAPTNPGHKADLDNQVKAILDACNKTAFPDDRWVDQIDAERFIGKECRLRLMIMQIGFKN